MLVQQLTEIKRTESQVRHHSFYWTYHKSEGLQLPCPGRLVLVLVSVASPVGVPDWKPNAPLLPSDGLGLGGRTLTLSPSFGVAGVPERFVDPLPPSLTDSPVYA